MYVFMYSSMKIRGVKFFKFYQNFQMLQVMFLG